MKPLAVLEPNTRAKIVSVEAGYGLKARLIGMGFVPGARVRVLENRGGHVIVVLGEPLGRVVALSRGVASKILVEEDLRS